MKKIISLFLCFVTLFSLCGCGGKSDADSRYLVTGVGLDFTKSKVNLSIELLVVGEEESTQKQVFSSSGNTATAAISNIKKSLAKGLSFEHCGVIAVNEYGSEKQLDAVLDFCKTYRDINLSVHIISAKNAQKLLESEPISNVAVGYDIMGILSQQGKSYEKQSRFYEVRAQLLNRGKAELPYFKADGKGFSLKGKRTVTAN